MEYDNETEMQSILNQYLINR